MYNAVINNGCTYLYLDNGKDNVYDGDMSGFLINNDDIINLMDNIPINQYYLKTKDLSIKISKDEAYFLYQELINYHAKKEMPKKLIKK